MPLLSRILAFLLLPQLAGATDWRTASRDSMGLSPAPQSHPEAIVQVFGARTYGKRGLLAVHTWIATKEKNATEYTTFEVIGWRTRFGGKALYIKNDIPDRRWFGADAELIDEIVGKDAEQAIVKIKKLGAEYPHADEYRVWPGPNSNTFVSWVIRNVPELRVELPPHAIGRDYLVGQSLVGLSESGSGLQFSVFGLLGLTLGLHDGIEFNVLGLSFGLDFTRPALKLPMIGRIGFKEKTARAVESVSHNG